MWKIHIFPCFPGETLYKIVKVWMGTRNRKNKCFAFPIKVGGIFMGREVKPLLSVAD